MKGEEGEPANVSKYAGNRRVSIKKKEEISAQLA